jgi:parvulin-like peptidyl-prolyl isomerase
VRNTLTLIVGFAALPAAPAPAAARGGDATLATPAPTTAPADDIVARIGNRSVTRSQLTKPLIEAHGLSVLVNLAQLEVAKENVINAGLTVTPDDIAREEELTMKMLFPKIEKADYPDALRQFLQQQNISRSEFQIIIERNAYLRKLAEPVIEQQVKEDDLYQAFLVLYGEKVKVRHIQVSNMVEIAEAKRRLAAGEKFEDVARALSRNARTAGLGGELPAFARMTQGLPESFKEAAFALQVGEVSDAVQSDGAYHLIKLDQRIPPTAVKFEDVKESVRETLKEQALQQAVQQMLNQLAEQVRLNLKVYEPALKEQFAARLEERQQDLRDREEYQRELARERQRRAAEQAAATQPATAPAEPATEPAPAATGPATAPAR